MSDTPCRPSLRTARFLGAVLLLGGGLLLGVGACKPEPLPGERGAASEVARPTAGEADEATDHATLLEIGSRSISLGEFERRQQVLQGPAELRYSPLGQRTSLLEAYASLELLAADATRQGWAGGAWEALAMAETRARVALNEFAAQNVDPEALEASLPAYFESRRPHFWRPETRRVHGIILDSREEGERVHAEVARALQVTGATHVFSRLAPLWSTHEASRQAGGLYGVIASNAEGGEHDPVLNDAVFAAADGSLLPLLQTSRGWEVVYVAQVRPGVNLTLEESRRFFSQEQMEVVLGREKADFLASLRADAHIQVNRELIDSLEEMRYEQPASGGRPRRYAVESLQGLPLATLGQERMETLGAQTERLFSNPNTRPAPEALPGNGEGSP